MVQYAVEQMRLYGNMRLGIPRFVELSGYSRSQLARIVHRCYGVSMQKLILDLRLDAAYRDIALTSDNIEDISEKVGYLSFSHFNKIFKTKFGITPAALRKSGKMRTV